MSDLRREVGHLWTHLSKAHHERTRECFRESDLPPMAFWLLRHLKQEPGLTVSEIARRAGTVKSHVSTMIGQFAEKGLLERRADPHDQRLVRVYMTPLALETLGAVQRRIEGAFAEVLEAVPEEQLLDVAVGLRILMDALERARDKATTED